MIDQVTDLQAQLGVVFIFGGDNRFRRFFAHLFQNLVYTFIKQIGCIGALWTLYFPFGNDPLQLAQYSETSFVSQFGCGPGRFRPLRCNC
ncbi:hypothetical protein D3C71_1905720 [compost metagenome]